MNITFIIPSKEPGGPPHREQREWAEVLPRQGEVVTFTCEDGQETWLVAHVSHTFERGYGPFLHVQLEEA